MFGNLLNSAASVIPQQTVQWVRFLSREQDSRGRWINTYSSPVSVRGSFQSMDAAAVKARGFDTEQVYKTLYTSHNMKSVQRGTSPDRIMYNDETYDIVGDTDWYTQDGWKRIYCVRIDPL